MPRSRYVADPRRDRADDEIAAWAQLIERRRPDVLLVDFVLPDDSETDVAQSLRRKDVTTPVLVITASPHRDAAFDACRFLIDWLKTRAPFWKLEDTEHGAKWVDAHAKDDEAAARWLEK